MSRIEVVVHPQSIVHSMVEFEDHRVIQHPILEALIEVDAWARREAQG